MNSKYLIIVVAGVFILSGCSKKRDSPFCFSCERGTLIYPEDNPKRTPLFFSENGDSLYLVSVNAGVFFQPGGRKVCAKMKQIERYHQDLVGRFYEAKCIKKD